MSLKSSTFQGIGALDQNVVDQLEDYLQVKETQMATKVYNFFLPEFEIDKPCLESSKVVNFTCKLSQLPQAIQQKIDQLFTSNYSTVPMEEWNQIKKKIDKSFWEYLELLEECSTEFFQQIDQLSVDVWNNTLANVIKKIKNILFIHLENFQKALYLIDSQINYYEKFTDESHVFKYQLKKILLFWKKNLDTHLFSNVDKCKKYLEFRYQNFSDRFDRYLIFQTKVNQASHKFEKYTVFLQLANEVKDKYLKIYRLVKFWELNTKTKSLPQRETIRSLTVLINPETAFEYFRLYFLDLQKAMFEVSKQLKIPNTYENPASSKQTITTLLGYRNELHTLGATLAKYRDFLIRTDPNPYVRSRIGFAEWVMGPEPIYTKQMLNLSYEIESMDSLLDEFINSLDRLEIPSESSLEELRSEILCLLYEMGQPLMSKPMMKLRAENLVNLIEQLDEIASFSTQNVEFIEQAMIKGLRGDWKYEVLFELPKFHKVYTVHQKIIGESNDIYHIKRKEKFHHLTQQIEQWVIANDTTKHSDEISLDIQDIKMYLQEFLSHVQRITSKDLTRAEALKGIRIIEHQLLEYRYLFGRFFHRLHETQPEEKMLRQQFLFVDQYFESIETQIQEWRSNAYIPNFS